MPWVLGAVVVLVLAVTAGLLSAWVVATMRDVPPAALGSFRPTPQATPTLTPQPTETGPATPPPTEVPRFTPTPSPVVTIEPEPFVHIVERGESLNLIAIFYNVDVNDILAMNDIIDPNLIRVGQELLIPGYGIRPSPEPG